MTSPARLRRPLALLIAAVSLVTPLATAGDTGPACPDDFGKTKSSGSIEAPCPPCPEDFGKTTSSGTWNQPCQPVKPGSGP